MKTDKYTTLLLDVDGTLLDFNEAERRGICAVMEHFGLTPTSEKIADYHQVNSDWWKAFERGDVKREDIFANRFHDFFQKYGLDVASSDAEPMYRGYLNSCAVLIKDALEICAWLKERYDLYVVTNGISHTQYTRLKDSGLDQYFTDIFVSEDTGSQKPHKEYFDYCFARIPEKDPSRMLIIGDSLSSDIKGGKNAGIDTCWLTDSDQNCPEELKPDYIIHELMELKKFYNHAMYSLLFSSSDRRLCCFIFLLPEV